LYLYSGAKVVRAPIGTSVAGEPAHGPKIRVGEPSISDLEREYVASAINAGDIAHFGAFVHIFEQGFSSYCGAAHGISTSSGTTALHLALTALGIGPGDEVIVPALTMIATINCVTYTGATPTLADIDPLTLTISPEHVARSITARTRAVVPVHLYGHPADLPALEAITKERGIDLVEDCAQAHGSEVEGRRVGSIGRVSAFSFYYNKIITTGEGGMVLTSDPELATRARLLRDQAFEPHERFIHRELGFNYRMTNLQAAVGAAQVERLDEIVARKQEIARWYRDLLQELPGLQFITEARWAKAVWWMTAIFVGDEFGLTRDQLARGMAKRGVETRKVFHPLHMQPLYQHLYDAECYPVAENAARRGLLLPSGATLARDDVEYVVEAIVQTKAKP
jgi:perosamine synthetase